MFGSGESFEYHECGSCGSLQIVQVPANLGAYYPRDQYYSFRRVQLPGRYAFLQRRAVRRLLKFNSYLFLRTGLGRGPAWTRLAELDLDSRILDLGCGDGSSLTKLSLLGYRHLTGADPFLETDALSASGTRLLASTHEEIEGEFDCIVMHHAFEHMADPCAALASARRLLAPGGRIVIRMPIRDCYAWDKYGTHWVQLDAPRHLVIYTKLGFAQLLSRAGFRLKALEYDSYAFQFWGSELVAQGLPQTLGSVVFGKDQLRKWKRNARRLNAMRRGDSIMALAVPEAPGLG